MELELPREGSLGSSESALIVGGRRLLPNATWGGAGGGPQHLVDLLSPIQPREDTVVPQGRARLEEAITAKPPGASGKHWLVFPSDVLGTVNTLLP